VAGTREEGRIIGTQTTLTVPPHRQETLERALEVMRGAQAIALTTHVNADGDGAGCEAALAAFLTRLGKRVVITNPTPFPPIYRHLVEDPDCIVEPGTVRTPLAMQGVDLLVVVDTSELSRIGRVASAARGIETVVIDHHLPSEEPIRGLVLRDEKACATGELIYDLLTAAGLEKPWPAPVSRGTYTAILTDTGSFRFANTTARAHAIAGDLISQGVDPERVYRRVYASVPLGRVRLLARALDSLEVDPEYPITWITLERSVVEGAGSTSEDMDGVVEQARTIEGTEVAILFRETADGSTKISLRSAGAADVNAIARQFGGGGHRKASGALIGAPLRDVVPRVLEATRAALRELNVESGSVESDVLAHSEDGAR
jgi:phosphoesterase RecJ-like protein